MSELMDIRSTAAVLKISTSTLYKLVREKAVPCYRTSPRGRIRLDLDEVRAALRANQQGEQ
jgi:excisionase family DNA binding protein